MPRSFVLVEKSVLRICRFPLKESLFLADHYYLSESGDFSRSLGWGRRGLEIHGRVRVTDKEKERVERFVVAARYSIAANNCEHFANFVKHGLSMSGQVDSWWMRLGAEAVAILQSTQAKRDNFSDYVCRQVSDLFEEDLRQARIARANKERQDFWSQRGVDVT